MAENLVNLLKPKWSKFPEFESDQLKKVAAPPLQKAYPVTSELIKLMASEEFTVGDQPLIKMIGHRKSRRKYSNQPLSLEELSYLLWATQGVKLDHSPLKRIVPSGGNRHPFETYLYISKVNGLRPGLYCYLPLEHQLVFLQEAADLAERVVEASLANQFVQNAAVMFVWTTIPYRTEWRYGPLAYKLIALDAGHLCQNLYLAAESINCGTCAIAAYDQEKWDALLGIDGEQELTIYMAPVGKKE